MGGQSFERRLASWVEEGSRLYADLENELRASTRLGPGKPADVEWVERFDGLRAWKTCLRKSVDSMTGAVTACEQIADSLEQELARRYLETLESLEQTGGVKGRIRRIEEKRVRGPVNRWFRALREEEIIRCIRESRLTWARPLSEGERYGRGYDERVIEIPLAFDVGEFSRRGKVLDAGAALNCPYLRRFIGRPECQIVHFTQSSEKEHVETVADRICYMYGDLRDMDFKDGIFDRVLCISTLEHVGMDNTRYGGREERAPQTYLQAFRELMRVLAPGGRLLVTVPYGFSADRGWYRVFGDGELAEMFSAGEGLACQFRYFYVRNGFWCEGTNAVPNETLSGEDEVTGSLALLVRK